MVTRMAERIEHHHGVCHRGENGAEPAPAVEPLGHEGDSFLDCALAHASGDQRLHHAE